MVKRKKKDTKRKSEMTTIDDKINDSYGSFKSRSDAI
jgi:hypothetical protein